MVVEWPMFPRWFVPDLPYTCGCGDLSKTLDDFKKKIKYDGLHPVLGLGSDRFSFTCRSCKGSTTLPAGRKFTKVETQRFFKEKKLRQNF